MFIRFCSASYVVLSGLLDVEVGVIDGEMYTPARYLAARTRPHAAPYSPIRRQCAAKLSGCERLHSGEERQPNSARRPRLAVMVEHSIELVMHRPCGLSGSDV